MRIDEKYEKWYDAARFIGLDPEGQFGSGPITKDMDDDQFDYANLIIKTFKK